LAAPDAAGLAAPDAAAPAGLEAAPVLATAPPVAGLGEAAVLTAMEAVAPDEVELVVTVPPQAASAAKDPAARTARPNRRIAGM
jgi:hypothetical protein